MKIKSYVVFCGVLCLTVFFIVLVKRFNEDEPPSKVSNQNLLREEQSVGSAFATNADDAVPVSSLSTPIVLNGSPEEQLRQLLAMDPTEECLNKLRENIVATKTEDMAKCRVVFEQSPPGEGLLHALKLYLKKWAETDPKAALDYAFKSENGPSLKLDAAGEVVKILAAQNIDDALAYFKTIERPEPRRVFMNDLAPALAKVDGTRTGQWIKSLPDNHQKQSAMFLALQQLTELNADTAAAWVETMIEEPFLQPTMPGICLMIADGKPSRAVEFLKHIPEGQTKDKTIQSVFGRWQLVNSYEAAEYCRTMPAGHEKEMAAKGMALAQEGVEATPF